MIAEVFLILAGHESSLFPTDHKLHPAFLPLLHPGEQQCLESLGQTSFRYRKLKKSCVTLSQSQSRYICALCAALSRILKDEYEALVISTEEKVLRLESFVPLSSVRAIFAEWDAPFAALLSLMDEIEVVPHWKPGPLIDLLLKRSKTGVSRVASILSRLSLAVQSVWRTQLTAFIVHGSLAAVDPLASESYVLLDGSVPACVSPQSRESIAYVGRAIATVKAAKKHTSLLEQVFPEDRHPFDNVIAQIRTSVSEWLWLNVLTRKDVDDAVDSLANYFLLRNGEFSLSLIREIERMKISRLTMHSGSAMIREQDLNLALLRASLGTTAQHDPSLSHLRFSMPACLLGTPLDLTYIVSWPLDLFLHASDLAAYGTLFAYLSSLRKTHIRIHSCWTSLSNSQRARRRWTGLGEGGTVEDLKARAELLRCGWGVIRDMGWFLDTFLGYVMMDVIDVEYGRLKKMLGQDGNRGLPNSSSSMQSLATSSGPLPPSISTVNQTLDFTSLRAIHSTYLDRLLTGCLLANSSLTAILLPIFEVCERFVAQVERWGGDILPALLFEGSLKGEDEEVGAMVKERHQIVFEIKETLHGLLGSFYDQLSLSTSQQPFTTMDTSKSILMNTSVANYTSYNVSKMAKGSEGVPADVRRHVERLLLRLDFNNGFSNPRLKEKKETDILGQGGLA
ncbi:gamma-tubulin ring complex protein [Desarmillaria tabescens]|uniref:Spindle pole body component n=1 Tax=Armillaria tabescens TaxID=1929756 RepID=A0AA39NHI3_ARMTA|nr:gamma-tubulin ring complex protein [Desarmillaria tabescens]KAK0465563.1 gamma-tubulin ring complex protein [Desarmillaria tabescens]